MSCLGWEAVGRQIGKIALFSPFRASLRFSFILRRTSIDLPLLNRILLAQICATLEIVRGSEFLRKVQRLARRRRVRFQYEPSLGKGSHGRVWLDTASTTLKDPKKELGTGLLRTMCRELKIETRDL